MRHYGLHHLTFTVLPIFLTTCNIYRSNNLQNIYCRDIGSISTSTQRIYSIFWHELCYVFEIWTAAIAWPGGHSHGCPYHENAARSSCSSLSGVHESTFGLGQYCTLKLFILVILYTFVYWFIVQVKVCWIHFAVFDEALRLCSEREMKKGHR